MQALGITQGNEAIIGEKWHPGAGVNKQQGAGYERHQSHAKPRLVS